MLLRAQVLLTAALFSLVSATAMASDEELAEGGRLYDKWWAEARKDAPTDTHPAYPLVGKQSGAATWRCKECHGWDYKGRDGAYAKGSHFTGIIGIRRWDGAEEDDVEKILIDANHRYDRVLTPEAIDQLAEFVTKGQLDMDPLISAVDKQVQADPIQGKALYQKACANCHGDDGRTLNFKTTENPEYLGTIGQKNPWELLHKIRNGQPGKSSVMMHTMMANHHRTQMPQFRALSVPEQAAVSAYVQTLPAQ